MNTQLTTAVDRSWPVSTATVATPVITRWQRPDRRPSMERASRSSSGLPSDAPSRTTSVSAARTVPAVCSAATARALRRASWTAAAGDGGPSRVSSAPDGTTSNSGQRKRSSSRRRGEAEARITRPAATRPASRDDQRIRVGDDAGLGVDGAADELRQAERVPVRLAVPVREVPAHAVGDAAVDLGRALSAGIVLSRGGDEPPRRAEAGDERLVARHHREHLAEGAVDAAEEVQLTDLRHAGLHGHGPAGGEPIAHETVELPGEEQARRSLFQGFDQIDHDEIEALGSSLEVAAGVLRPDFRARVVEGTLVH